MFLQPILRRNPLLIDACVSLHQQGKIPANSYVLDLDTIRENAAYIATEGAKHGLRVFAMTKQIGRNPAALQVIQQAGIAACVCVDMADARAVHAAGVQVGHLGHLVQVPTHEVAAAVAMRPLFWTVYSLDKAREISAALPQGQTQNVLARVFAKGDTFYKGHEGGFPIEEIEEVVRALNALPGITCAGLSTFPTQLFNPQSGQVEPTHNFQTLLDTAARLQPNWPGLLEINAPGTTSSMLFAQMAAAGVTQVEPGHGLTGTCPQHARQDLTELPAMAYISEVSHRYAGKDYCFGGGMYIDPVFGLYNVQACVGRTPQQARAQLISCDMPKPEAIDYYGILQSAPENNVQTGDTVVFGFRAQAFVTRAYVVPVAGVHSGAPHVVGIYTTDGKEAGWPQC